MWTCRGCGVKHHGNKLRCDCGRSRPRRRKPKHRAVLEERPYEDWVLRFGEHCGICHRPPGPRRHLDRDHSHRTGKARGLLCHRCNRALSTWITVKWLRAALAYLEKADER